MVQAVKKVADDSHTKIVETSENISEIIEAVGNIQSKVRSSVKAKTDSSILKRIHDDLRTITTFAAGALKVLPWLIQ